MLGRHRKALAALGKLFKQGKVGKTYWAVVEGGPEADGRPHRYSARQARREPRLVDEARSAWHTGGDDVEGDGARMQLAMTWLALEPLTGRTHQLRVHCAEMGFPIVGDNIYGSAPRTGGPPLHLHAREVTVPISKNKPPVTVTAPVPAHMREMLSACGWTPSSDSKS